MAKNKNWFGPVQGVKPTTARMVRFGNVAQKLVPGAASAIDTVYIERQRAVAAGAAAKKAEVASADTSDFVLRLVNEG